MTDMIAKIFRHCGYSVKYGIFVAADNLKKTHYIPDLILEDSKHRAIVEIKAPQSMVYRTPVSAAQRFLHESAASYPDVKRILIFVCSLPDKKQIKQLATRNSYRLNETFELFDIYDLLNMVEDDAALHAEFTSLLPKPVQDPTLGNSQTSERNELDELIHEVENWEVCDDNGKNRHKEYEQLCVRVLKALFHDELGLWDEQPTSLDGLNRFDIVCKIKAKGNDFWDILDQHFHSKYIIFECKNYQDSITQREVYTTEKYLYSTALRRVAFLISVNGTGESAEKAIRGILRETGKLIIPVTNNDLVEMLKHKQSGQNPAVEVLGSLLDRLLVKLEK